MCRMLGVASRSMIPVSLFEEFQRLAISGKSLAELGEQHQDGWGVAGYLGNWAVHFGRSEKGVTVDHGSYASAVQKSLNSESKIVIAHLRKASTGTMRIENSHPFINNDWIFCHNGTVHDAGALRTSLYEYEGTTDSELLFKHFMSRLERRGIKEYPAVIKECVDQVKKKFAYSSLTFLMANGSYLIGYRDCCKDEDYYTLHYAYSHTLFLFCSEQLPGFNWTAMKNGELIIVDKIGGFLNEF